VRLFDIVKKSSAMYRANPILILPPFVSMVFSLVTLFVIGSPPDSPTSGASALELMRYAFTVFGVLFLNLIISFLVILGQVSMTREVILEGKTGLSDWGKGIKRYFLRVLGIGLIYLVLVWALSMFVGGISLLTILAHTLPSPQISTLILIMISSVSTLLMTVASTIFYIWLAPAVIDDKEVFESLKAGTEAMGKGGKTFLGFIALYFLVSLVTLLIAPPSYFGTSVQPSSVEYITPKGVTSQVITTIFSPLWFLIAFTIYNEQKSVT